MGKNSDLETTSVVEITKSARLYSASIFDDYTHQSLPIPVVSNQILFMGYLYCRAEIVEPGEGLKIWTPSFLAYVTAETRAFERVAAVDPGKFGLSDPTDTPIGSYLSPPQQRSDDHLTKRVKLMQAYDQVITAWLRDMDRKDPEVVKQRSKFRKLFSEVSEDCLLGYYRAVGKDFFAWTGVISGEG